MTGFLLVIAGQKYHVRWTLAGRGWCPAHRKPVIQSLCQCIRQDLSAKKIEIFNKCRD
jgi:hypothetical protein